MALCGPVRWEAEQPAYQRTLWVLESVQRRLQALLAAGGAAPPGCEPSSAPANPPSDWDACQAHGELRGHGSAGTPAGSRAAAPAERATAGEGGVVELANGGRVGSADADRPAAVRSMLLCGADVVASFAAPGVWPEDLLRGILRDHGVVCIARCRPLGLRAQLLHAPLAGRKLRV